MAVNGREGRTQRAPVEAICSDMASRARKKAPTTPFGRGARRARRSLLSARPGLPRLELAPHQLDVIALALVALGVFLAAVAYGGVSGGPVGRGLTDGARFMLGAVGYAVPVGLVIAGGLLLMRELRTPARPLRTGTVFLVASVTLALASGALGLGPGALSGRAFWHAAAFRTRGGLLGQGEFWLASHLLSTTGAEILAVFLFVAGLLLVTGAGAAGIIRSARDSVAGTTRVMRRRTGELAQTVVDRTAPPPAAGPLLPPEPDTSELVIRATHVEAPPAFEFEAEEPEELEVAPEPLLDLEPEDEPPLPEPSDLTPQGRYRSSVTDDPSFTWRVPSARFLVRSTGDAAKPDTAGQEQVARTLLETLGHFGIEAKVIGRVTGPHITRYELRLAPGTKVSKVAQLKDDLAYALAATDIRILAPIPGKQAVGVEVPNALRRIVHLGDVFQEPPGDWSVLSVWLGKDVAGRAIGADLSKMPHLLVAGTTGSGKSACVNAMLASILLRATPHEVRFVMVDPKQVELNHYESIPHLLTPVITSPRMASNALQNLVKEMETRYGMMSLARTRALPELNRAREQRGEPALPYILCVIDELADLMMVAPAEVEDAVIRLAQKARAVGIHLVVATQSPRVDVITGMIKANIPSRIAFAVSSQTDSRVILDQNGAETLLGQGDMLFSPLGAAKLQRIQGAFIDEEQIAELTDAWRRQGEPEFHDELLAEVPASESGGEDGDGEYSPDEDPLLDDAIALVAQMGTASTSMLQRRLRLGYTRAGRLIDMLERRGIISGYEGSKPRQVLISEADVPRILSHLAEAEAPAPVGARPDVTRGTGA